MARNKEIRIKLSTAELENISSKANMLGMPISTFMRFISLKASLELDFSNTPISYLKKKRLE